MEKLGMSGTKWNILKESIELFANKGYANISIRDIAKKVKIKSATLYYHFENKDAILAEIYEFYNTNFFALLPKAEDIIALVGKEAPDKILKRLNFAYEEKLNIIMAKIIKIAVKEKDYDKRAAKLINTTFVIIPNQYWGAVINKMVELKIIEPLDVNSWVIVLTHYDFAATLRAYRPEALSIEEWKAGRKLLIDLIHFK